jgi:uncharacterized lipoprotein NlpE involved in copper resistance
MKRIVLIVAVILLLLAGCSNKADKVFQPLSQNPEYAVVIKTQTPNKILGSAIVQGDQLKKIVNEINSSHKLIAAKSCPASTDGYDVIVHFSNGLIDRTFTALSCPGTVNQADGITIEPGISVENLNKLFMQ